MKPAVLIIDMLKETLEGGHRGDMSRMAREIVPAINELTAFSRDRAVPVIFCMDSFLRGDFIFQGRMKEHSIRGTRGAEVTDLLDQRDGDWYVPKRRFSAFYKTDLDQTLRLLGADTVFLTGIATHVCVLSTAFDALSNDFAVRIVEDCCAAFSREVHRSTLGNYRETPLSPLLRIATLGESMEEIRLAAAGES
jgi:nicotinamidase-related amidase